MGDHFSSQIYNFSSWSSGPKEYQCINDLKHWPAINLYYKISNTIQKRDHCTKYPSVTTLIRSVILLHNGKMFTWFDLEKLLTNFHISFNLNATSLVISLMHNNVSNVLCAFNFKSLLIHTLLSTLHLELSNMVIEIFLLI